MTNNVEDFQSFNKEQLEKAATSASSFAKSVQTIACETTSYSKKAVEDGAAFLEKLRQAKSVETAIQLQSEYAKTSCEAFIAQATKVAELYANLGKAAFKPIEEAITKVQSGKN